MTPSQARSLITIQKELRENISEYVSFGSPRLCSLNLKKSTNPLDKSITAILTIISEIDDNNIPVTKLVFYNILDDGEIVSMNLLMTRNDINNYVAGLVDFEA